MFRRLVFEDSATVFTLVAFACAAAVYASLSWRALRMRRTDAERFSHLPFATPTPDARHDHAE